MILFEENKDSAEESICQSVILQVVPLKTIQELYSYNGAENKNLVKKEKFISIPCNVTLVSMTKVKHFL